MCGEDTVGFKTCKRHGGFWRPLQWKMCQVHLVEVERRCGFLTCERRAATYGLWNAYPLARLRSDRLRGLLVALDSETQSPLKWKDKLFATSLRRSVIRCLPLNEATTGRYPDFAINTPSSAAL